MTGKIKRILYKNIELLSYSNKTNTYLRLQNYERALHYSVKTIDAMINILEDILSNQTYFNETTVLVEIKAINQILNGLLEAQESKDYVLLADLFELQLNPFILSLQEEIIIHEEFNFDEEMYHRNIDIISKRDEKLGKQLGLLNSPFDLLETRYSVEYSACGLMTLALYDNSKKYYMHSNGQVLHEAEMLARGWFTNDASQYFIYGFGFGYHVKELMELDESITICVYESDLNIIQLACAFTDLSKILLSDRVHLIYDPKFNELNAVIANLEEEQQFLIHYPSIRNIKNCAVKERLEDYFISYSSVNNQLHSLNNNFRKNILHYDEYIDNLKDQFTGKDLYIIAAGPSLDKNYMQLKNLGDNAIILATGTVYKKLLHVGINPDYVVIIDATALVYQQVEDIEKNQIPLLFLSTAYYKISEAYLGKKYLICQEGFKKAEEFANKSGFKLYHTGGSVSTMALDIGIQFECKRIICIGLDLAYSNNKDHASDTPMVNTVTTTDLRQVEDIYGNKVETTRTLDIYRKWIERRIKNIRGIEFIDATEGGAKIEGMKIKNLSECIFR